MLRALFWLTMSLSGWQAQDPGKPNEWVIEDGLLVNGKSGKTVNLVTTDKYGDVEAEIEFMVPKGSNSGVYFQGLYEIQILDSYGKTDLKFGDCGGIYARYIDGKTVGGAAPRVNASKAPGEWQTFRVWFRAPRFDASGKKIGNAVFEKVLHNGVLIHENVEVEGPTRASMNHAEAATGPMMLQGDHGPVAFRKIEIKRRAGSP